ncbi:hypothetical protein CLOLEP_02953 [[Clostridium] leptum DSM 753]|uniref:Uncharacterized protein n=1 Tax=[Clostridium] leptum DSM 753 TaxID=428125 RepID=A7VWI8_9FIRM|nr:hypothetical protein CLOLEP_02953 [[Clostridium] leptum DSM 753]
MLSVSTRKASALEIFWQGEPLRRNRRTKKLFLSAGRLKGILPAVKARGFWRCLFF